MTIKDIITLVRAGYTKDEINATLAAAAALPEEQPAPVDMPEKAAEPAPAAAEQPAEDPRIAELESQVKELQAKLIQLNSVNTIPADKDPMLEIGNALINGGRIK